MSPTIDEYKTSGLTLINTAQRYIDTEPIQNDIASIGKNVYIFYKFLIRCSLDKAWSEYIEYILDTLDYIQLHQDELREFSQLSNDLLSSLEQKQKRSDSLNNNELKNLNEELEKYYEQVELLNQKGELLLQSSATNLNDDNDNHIERLLETINRNYDGLAIKTKARIENADQVDQPKPTTTITEEEVIAKIQ
jgi:chaperonin cofactor prefoldin